MLRAHRLFPNQQKTDLKNLHKKLFCKRSGLFRQCNSRASYSHLLQARRWLYPTLCTYLPVWGTHCFTKQVVRTHDLHERHDPASSWSCSWRSTWGSCTRRCPGRCLLRSGAGSQVLPPSLALWPCRDGRSPRCKSLLLADILRLMDLSRRS